MTWYAIYADGEPQPRNLAPSYDADAVAAAGLKVEAYEPCEYGFDWMPNDPVKYRPRAKPKAILVPSQLMLTISPAEWAAIRNSTDVDVRYSVDLIMCTLQIDLNLPIVQALAHKWESLGLIGPGRAQQIIDTDKASLPR